MYYPTNLISLVVILSFFLGTSLSIFLLFSNHYKNKGNLWLGLIVVYSTLYFLAPFLSIVGLLETFPHTVRLYAFASCVIGPIIYFYIQDSSQMGFKLTKKDLLHFIPAFCFFIYYIPFLLQSGEQKLIYFKNLNEHGIIGDPMLLPLINSIHAFIYFFISVNLIFKYKKHLSNNVSLMDTSFLRWLFVFSSFLLIPISTVTMFVLFGQSVTPVAVVLTSIFVFLMAIFVSLLFKPKLFHSFPFQIEIEEENPSLVSSKYESSNLKEDQKDKYIEKLSHFINIKKPYTDPELTLPQLAESIDIPKHHLSQIINEKLNCNFLDFINSHRIEDAKNRLRDPKFDHFTIIAIAYDVGFNSKSTFYTSFKKFTNSTPSQFRKAQVYA